MWLDRPTGWVCDMSDERPRVSVDVRLDCEPVEGEITRPDGSAVHFSGWIELAAALERERAVTPPKAPRADRRAS